MSDRKHDTPSTGAPQFHLFCPYHGGLGVSESLEDASDIAHQHIMDQHVNSSGHVAPGADVHIQEKVHFTAEHSNARLSPPPAAHKK